MESGGERCYLGKELAYKVCLQSKSEPSLHWQKLKTIVVLGHLAVLHLLPCRLHGKRCNTASCPSTTTVSYSAMKNTSLAYGESISKIFSTQSLSHHQTHKSCILGKENTITATEVSKQ